MDEEFDGITTGAGRSGPSLARRLTSDGLRTAIIERTLFGGTCLNVGCTPTKMLVASARTAHVARCAHFGVLIDGSIQVDMGMLKARKDAVVKQWGIEAVFPTVALELSYGDLVDVRDGQRHRWLTWR